MGKMQADLNMLSDWCRTNGISVNVKKNKGNDLW